MEAPDGGEWLSDMDLRKDFNTVKADLFEWSGDLSRNVAKNAVIDMEGLDARGAYCKALKHGQTHRKAGFPPVRKRYRKVAFPPANGCNSIKVDGRQARLPRSGRMRMREALRFDGDILKGTVSRPLVCLVHGGHVRARAGPQIRTRHRHRHGREDAGRAVGRRAQDDDRQEQALADLRATQRAIGRSVKLNGNACTNHRRRLHGQPARQHARVARIRANHHKATTQIAQRGGRVTVEALNVDGMKHHRRLARTISDAGMAEFVRQLEYKCGWHGTEFRRVDHCTRRRKHAVHAEP